MVRKAPKTAPRHKKGVTTLKVISKPTKRSQSATYEHTHLTQNTESAQDSTPKPWYKMKGKELRVQGNET